jgi:hypothetical protein
MKIADGTDTVRLAAFTVEVTIPAGYSDARAFAMLDALDRLDLRPRLEAFVAEALRSSIRLTHAAVRVED